LADDYDFRGVGYEDKPAAAPFGKHSFPVLVSFGITLDPNSPYFSFTEPHHLSFREPREYEITSPIGRD